MLMLATLLLAACLVARTDAADTVLDDQFCQNYYNLDDGNCEDLRSTVRSRVRGRGTPTLEMGDSERQPAMVFIHNWPETSASFANQFAAFCGEQGGYFCVAPSLIDFHPDYPRADVSELLWSNQVETLHAVVEDLGLTNITLVINHFLGYQYTYFYSNNIRRVIGLDMGLTSGPTIQLDFFTASQLPMYQKINIMAFQSDDDDLMMRNIEINMDDDYPCQDCRIAPPPTGVANITGVGARTGWIYYDFIRMDYPWTSFFNVPLEEWTFNFIPSFPEGVPILFLYNTGFLSDDFFRDWIDGRGDGVSEHMRVPGDHWFMIWNPDTVNREISQWLIATENN